MGHRGDHLPGMPGGEVGSDAALGVAHPVVVHVADRSSQPPPVVGGAQGVPMGQGEVVDLVDQAEPGVAGLLPLVGQAPGLGQVDDQLDEQAGVAQPVPLAIGDGDLFGRLTVGGDHAGAHRHQQQDGDQPELAGHAHRAHQAHARTQRELHQAHLPSSLEPSTGRGGILIRLSDEPARRTGRHGPERPAPLGRILRAPQ